MEFIIYHNKCKIIMYRNIEQYKMIIAKMTSTYPYVCIYVNK